MFSNTKINENFRLENLITILYEIEDFRIKEKIHCVLTLSFLYQNTQKILCRVCVL